ncbi:uncharacterized protein LOC133736985 isoform X2 [Rosa rugosa]|uniref:uncharacterized protein LOC133736985 isoform X2 n=1 Tax=Rosa rugosa TaxID=74645 RepID=UPI002B402231|nr:uncharacterized protein LOC133736985 isoform X2 [Rosa rugosa]
MESEFCNSGWVLWIHQEKPKSWYLIQELLFPRQHSGENVNKYLENYEMAFTGFETAALKDPGLNATEEVQKIVNLLDKLDNLLRGHARSKRLASLASSLAVVNLNSSYKTATVNILSEGLNKAVALVGKVLFFIKHENVAPLPARTRAWFCTLAKSNWRSSATASPWQMVEHLICTFLELLCSDQGSKPSSSAIDRFEYECSCL